jgi:hypothetical protein
MESHSGRRKIHLGDTGKPNSFWKMARRSNGKRTQKTIVEITYPTDRTSTKTSHLRKVCGTSSSFGVVTACTVQVIENATT